MATCSMVIVVWCTLLFASALAHNRLTPSEVAKTADCPCYTQKAVDCGAANVEKAKTALAALATNKCNTWTNTTALNVTATTTCNSNNQCLVDFAFVLEIHDGCPVKTLPAEVDKGIHDYQSWCANCFTPRVPASSYPTCDDYECHDQIDFQVAADYLKANCTSNCGSENCTESFKRLTHFHDVCFIRERAADNSVSLAKQFTDFISVCANKGCNAYNSTYWSTNYVSNCSLPKNGNATLIAKEIAAKSYKSAAQLLSTSHVVTVLLAVWAFVLAAAF